LPRAVKMQAEVVRRKG